jgi:hypothetical protein
VERVIFLRPKFRRKPVEPLASLTGALDDASKVCMRFPVEGYLGRF